LRRLHQGNGCGQPGFVAIDRRNGGVAPIRVRRDVKAARRVAIGNGVKILDDEARSGIFNQFPNLETRPPVAPVVLDKSSRLFGRNDLDKAKAADARKFGADISASLVSVAKRSSPFKIAGFSQFFLLHFLEMSVCLWTHV
jgi:hypothetical protein